MNTIDNLAINSIRILSADAIQKANSGHPGLPLGSAPMAYELWAHHMNHNPANPEWANRDRFIYLADMAPCCCIPCFTCSDTALQRKTL